MDLALQMKDYEWAKQLQDEEHTKEVKVDYASLNNQIQSDKQVETDSKYNQSIIALENITTNIIVKTNEGARNVNIMSEYDRLDSDIGVAEKQSYSKGENIKFYSPDVEELYYLKGYYQGYYDGILQISYQNYETINNLQSLCDKYKQLLDVESNLKNYYMEKCNKNVDTNKKWYQFWKR
jgi:hypothetical protein